MRGRETKRGRQREGDREGGLQRGRESGREGDMAQVGDEQVHANSVVLFNVVVAVLLDEFIAFIAREKEEVERVRLAELGKWQPKP